MDEPTLADAYLQLLASSTTSRYLRKATEFAQAIADRPTAEIAARARELLAAATRDDRRTPAEAELAIALAALAKRWDEEEARSVIEVVAATGASALSWAAAMARWLRDRRPPTDS